MKTEPLNHGYEIISGEVVNVKVSFDNILDSGETLSSATVSELFSSDLTLGSPAVGGASATIRGKVVATGRWLQFSVQGTVEGKEYVVQLDADTSESQTLKPKLSFDGI